MQLSPDFVDFAAFTAEIVFFVLLSLNIASCAIIAERALFFWRRRIDPDQLARHMLYFVKLNDVAKARTLLARYPAPETAVLLAGLADIARGPRVAEAAMASARVRERIRMEANLTMLRAIAFAAPALGVMGTVLGLVSVMPHLSIPLVNPQGIVGSAAREALGAIAIAAAGLMVGIPAGVATLLFERRVRLSEERIAILAHLTLAATIQAEMAPAIQTSTGDDDAPGAAAEDSPAAAQKAALVGKKPTLRPLGKAA